LGKLVFYTNESVNLAVAEGLKRRGVKVITARDAGNLGLSDDEQLEYAKRGNLVIITHDDDFLSLAMGLEHKGIVFVHQQKYSIGDLIRNLKLLWDTVEQKDMKNHTEFL
jgi:predicted nuclease of predicted toxin-antitoxin system